VSKLAKNTNIVSERTHLGSGILPIVRLWNPHIAEGHGAMAHFRVAIVFRMATSSCTAQALVDRHATALLRRRSMAQQRSGARHELRPIRLCV